jgi:hypothetical protein
MSSRRATTKPILTQQTISGMEGASRLLESGWPIHHVQEMLGHSSRQQGDSKLRS